VTRKDPRSISHGDGKKEEQAKTKRQPTGINNCWSRRRKKGARPPLLARPAPSAGLQEGTHGFGSSQTCCWEQSGRLRTSHLYPSLTGFGGGEATLASPWRSPSRAGAPTAAATRVRNEDRPPRRYSRKGRPLTALAEAGRAPCRSQLLVSVFPTRRKSAGVIPAERWDATAPPQWETGAQWRGLERTDRQSLARSQRRESFWALFFLLEEHAGGLGLFPGFRRGRTSPRRSKTEAATTSPSDAFNTLHPVTSEDTLATRAKASLAAEARERGCNLSCCQAISLGTLWEKPTRL